MAATEGAGVNQFLRPQRLTGDIQVDGRLDEPAWRAVPSFEGFVQRFPASGKPPSERTSVRVLYDDRNLYLGIYCYDSQPHLINRNLGRRDADLYTDAVRVLLDPLHDHRTAWVFSLSASGAQADGLYYNDNLYTAAWDGVWDGAAGLAADGWVAELVIPLELLRFPDVPVQTWGFSVRRDIAHRNEELETVDNPRTSNAVVSRLGHLTGMDVKPRRALEVVPYLAARAVARPQFSDAQRPRPRLVDPLMDLGVDLRMNLTSDLALAATLNPDFGQLEADELILNLTNFEAFFPERRPFFIQGMELFQPLDPTGDGDMPYQLFYSRRIGLDAPIFGAARMTGSVTQNLEIGVLDAVVAGPWQRAASESQPDRRLGLYLSRPLHLGLNNALPTEPVVPANHLAAVARAQLSQGLRLGATALAVTPLTGSCGPEETTQEMLPAACRALGGNVLAADLDWRSADGTLGVVAQVVGSQVVGGLPERIQPDGTRLHPGDTGLGGFLRAGRLGGEGLRWDVGYDLATPTLELTASGFQPAQNEHTARGVLRYNRDNGWGWFKAFSAKLQVLSRWTADDRLLSRGTFINAELSAQLPTFDEVTLGVGREGINGWDIRELAFTGVPLEQPLYDYVLLAVETNPNRPLSLSGDTLLVRRAPSGPSPAGWVFQGGLTGTARPHPALETQLGVEWSHFPYGPRFVEQLDGGAFVLGDLVARSLSLTLRQQWVLTPRLTLQAYAQVFTASGSFGPFYQAATDSSLAPIPFARLTPLEREDRDSFYQTALNLNAVLRWEYRLGSVLYLVYTRSQQGAPPLGQPAPTTLWPQRLLDGPDVDTLMLKWSWYLDV